jgi:hypothetical protein
MRRLGLLTAALVLAALLTPAPAHAAGSGAVTGTVTAAAPCITLDVDTLDFGTHPFNKGSSNYFGQGGPVVVTNCGGATETVFGSVSDATSGELTWTPAAAASGCAGESPVTNQFLYIVSHDQVGHFLTGTDQELAEISPLEGENTGSFPQDFFMPCVGSDGAGQTFSTTMTFTVTF